jgi:hypothetical protein
MKNWRAAVQGCATLTLINASLRAPGRTDVRPGIASMFVRT